MSKTLQVRDLPEGVHAVLAQRAAQRGESLSAYLRAELATIAARPDRAELLARLRSREPLSDGGPSAAEVLREMRDARG